MNRTSCVMNIKSKMKTLTGSEKKVANYILNNYMYILVRNCQWRVILSDRIDLVRKLCHGVEN